MNGRRWVSGAVAMAGVVALVAPAVSQGKAEHVSLQWSLAVGATITSYDFGNVDAGSRGASGFRLQSSSMTKSGRLAISLTGSPAFSITADRCTRKRIGQYLSCWVGVAYAPPGAGANGRATLRATDGHGAAVGLHLTGCSPAGPDHVYWTTGGGNIGTVNGVSLGGGCVTTFARGNSDSALAVDGTNVYWVNDGHGTVNETPLGGGSPTVLAGGQFFPSALAVDATHVYWVTDGSNGTVNEVPIGGGSMTTLATGQDGPVSVAVDSAHVYWVNYYDGTVNEVPLGGGLVTTLAAGQTEPRGLAVDGTHVYWTTDTDAGTVNEVPLGGGSVTALASGQAYPDSVTVDGSHVYWVNEGDGTVNEVPLGGGSVTALATGQRNPRSVAVDGTHVYWADGSGSSNGSVKEVPVGGGSVTTLASGQDNPAWVAVGP